MRGEIKEYALNQMNHTISAYNKTGYEASTQTWNLIQSDVNNVHLITYKTLYNLLQLNLYSIV